MAALEKSVEDQSTGKLASLLEEHREGLLTCVHCGLCLPSCPTYRALGNENDSPRGRIYLMRGLVEGRLEPGKAFTSHIDLCLGCRACETVCPSGVPYGQLLEGARAEISRVEVAAGSLSARLTKFVLNQVFTRPALLRIAFFFSRLFRDCGLAEIAFSSDFIKGRLKLALALLLTTRKKKFAAITEKSVEQKPSAANKSKKAMTVGLLRGCVMEGLFSHTNRATERVLERNGCKISDVPGQVCCGALHAHAGQIETAKELARHNIDAFLDSGVERIVVNAAGCGAAMKEYAHLLSGDPEYSEKARKFSSRVRDVSELLNETGISQGDAKLDIKVAYDAPCHLIHAQKVVDPPLKALRALPGAQLVPLKGYETCCGGAGIYNLLHPELSAEILEGKLSSIRESGAQIVATCNPGCLMQIGAGILMKKMDVEVAQVVDLLDASYSSEAY